MIIVAPRVGAWIETLLITIYLLYGFVAPRVGAWIETVNGMTGLALMKSHPVWVRGLKHIQTKIITAKDVSHPVWVRGLKHNIGPSRYAYANVAPRVGAWIETILFCLIISLCLSHPVWVRGLKHGLEVVVPCPSRRTPCGCVD